MQHFFQDKRFEDNWMTYPHLYKQFADQLKDHQIMVELGSWKGQSAAFMAAELKMQNKNGVRFFCIDTWQGTSEDEHGGDKWVKEGKLFEKFTENLLEVSDERASYLFPEQSVDICFVDADHSYDGVTKDLELWTPKVKPGGIMSGHDYDPTGSAWQECRRAVDDFWGKFGKEVKATGGLTWVVQL
jgi:predicted O-methyltransferase YrrM